MPAIEWTQWTKTGKRKWYQKSFNSEAEVEKFIAKKMKTEGFIEVVAGR